MVELQHVPDRPAWTCSACGEDWPCEPARAELRAEQSGSYLTLSMWINMVDAARDNPRAAPARLYERFVGWTQQ